ncbi:MAG: lamin tail domain-containing protein [Phycisphaerae bacterium]|nr:lamin tail domain-containing protein [Phycisphaerae bacterium]
MKSQWRYRYSLLAITCMLALWVAQPCTALVVSELMYHPVEEGGTPDGDENLEFIELYNNRAVFEDLSSYAFTNGIEYTFTSGTVLPAKQYLVVAKDPAALEAAYGITGVYGPFDKGKLNNDGERVELSNENGAIIISFRYNDARPWPASPDGAGHSLILAKLGRDPEEASTWAPSTFIGGTPGGPDEAQFGPGALRARIVINELLANSDVGLGTDWIELYNPGPISVDLGNLYLSDGRFELLQYKIPSGIVLQPGEFWAVREGTPPSGLPFALSYAGETIFLTAASSGSSPRPLRVLDTVRFPPSEADVALGRYPDGADCFGTLTAPTFNGPNAKPLIRDIVINEIMYHHGSRDERYEYVELYNKGAGAISLDGWSFTDGIAYDFNETSQVTQIPAGGHLVVAKDPSLLETVYDNLTIGLNLVGPYSKELDDHKERVRLSYPYQDPETLDVNMITVDEVTYYDGGMWPMWADGQGASMELRDPRSNNDSPNAWAASDESAKATWRQFSFTVNGNDPSYTHGFAATFDMMLLNRGDVLLDDLELVVGGANRLTNSGFESGQSGWRTLGNHVQSFVTTEDSRSGSQCLHLVATGHGDPGANRINRPISGVTGGNVTFRGWARWLRGSKHLLLRTTQDRSPVQPPRPAHSFELTMPMDLGTPGEQNTAFVSNRGPDISEVRHAPVLPAAYEPIVVTARVADNDNVGSVRLYYRSEGSGSFSNVAMRDDAYGNDLVEQDGIYTAAIPGASGGTMRAFYILASDGSASTRFPTMLEPSANVPERTCLVRVGDDKLDTPFATYRVWMSNAVVSTFRSRPNLSNELMDCTFVYNDTDVFYSARIRHRGSPFLRNGAGRAPYPAERHGFRIDFNPDQQYRNRQEINLDGTEGSGRGPLQERASYWFYRQMGLQYSTQEYVRPIMNGNTAKNYEDVQKIDGDYIDAWFPDNDDGYIHKVDDYFEYTADGTGFSNLDEGLKYDSSHPLIKETYRWGFEKRSHREDDNWDHIFDFAVAMNTPSTNPGAYEAAIRSVIHPEHFAAVLAIRHAVGDWDSYGYDRGKNNLLYYTLPEGKWYLLPWDIDFALGSGHGAYTNLFALTTSEFPEVYTFFNHPTYRQTYLQAFAVLVNGPWRTSYGTGNPPTAFDRFLDDAADALVADRADAGRRNSIKRFVRDRRNFILPQVPPLVFEITARLRHIYTTASPVTIGGVAPFHVTGISANGIPRPAEFSTNNAFTVAIPIPLGMNVLTLQALDAGGNPISGLTDSITVTRMPPSEVTSLTPSTVCSNGTAALTIHGTGFEPGSETTVALTRQSGEVGFDALYVRNSEAFDQIEAATLLLDYPDDGPDDPVRAVHQCINLWNSGSHGEFYANETHFASPFNTDGDNYAVRFTGYIYAPSRGVRYFGVSSDEGFTLSIAGQLVGQYASGRTAATTDVTKNRTAGTMLFDFPAEGRYYLVLDFFENGGGEEIEFFQTNATAGDQKLINVDSELIVFRDDTKRVDATDVVVAAENMITCHVDLADAEPDTWNVIVTPEAGDAWRSDLDNALEIVACRSNFNHDSQVDFLDLTQLADKWQQQCSAPLWCGGTDLDQSNRVDFGDVAVLADEWLLPAR